MFGLQRSSVSTGGEPVTVADLKTHLRIPTTAQGGSSAEDTLLGSFITIARQMAENKTKRAILPSSWLMTIDNFGSSVIELPNPPLSTVSTNVVITYTKTTGDTTTLDSTVYEVEPKAEPGFFRLAYQAEWPTDLQPTPGAVRIAYTSGYSTGSVPEPIQQYIKLRAGQMYEQREAIETDAYGRAIFTKPIYRDFLDGLLDPYTVIDIL